MSDIAISRDIMLAQKEYQIELAEAAYLESMIENKLRINLAKAEYKVLTESADATTVCGDLVYLFNEAGKEAEEQKEGVVKKVGNAIYSFLVKLWNSIQKIFTGKNTAAYNDLTKSKKTFECPFDPAKFLQGVSQLDANLSEDTRSNIGKKVAIGAALSTMTAAVAAWGVKKYKVSGEESHGIFEHIKNISSKLLHGNDPNKKDQNAAQQDNNEDLQIDDGKGGKKTFKGLTNGISQAFGEVYGKVEGFFKRILGQSGDEDNTNNADNTADAGNGKKKVNIQGGGDANNLATGVNAGSTRALKGSSNGSNLLTGGTTNTNNTGTPANGATNTDETPDLQSANEYVDPEMMAMLESL